MVQEGKHITQVTTRKQGSSKAEAINELNKINNVTQEVECY
ncbi:hypothetical protein GMMP15_1750006 [Candidatus Magnetomoraceae bacterium gMMP-15]